MTYSCQNNFRTTKDIKCGYATEDAQYRELHFELLIGALAQNLVELWPFFVWGHLNMNIEDNVKSLTVTSSLTSSTLKKVFSGVIFDVLAISDVKMSLSEIFKIFQNGRHFDVRVRFLNGSSTGSWVQILNSQSIPNILNFRPTF